MKYAHKLNDRKQTIYDHLKGVADKASSFSVDFMRDFVYTAGLAHDIGKYAEDFQKRLNGSKIRFEHSACGAIEIGELPRNKDEKDMTYMLQYCIAGHHTGLPDGGTPVDSADADTTLNAKLNRKKYYTEDSDYSSYKEEIKLHLPDYSKLMSIIGKSKSVIEVIEKYAFFTRYIFSCLTDADYLDTERFYSPDTDRSLNADFEKMLDIINEELKKRSIDSDTPLKKARKELQEQAFGNCLSDSRINILDMPTGSGKTLCSMKIALKKLIEHKKKRIIYVIPYTSIIEQTAEIFEGLFGKYADIVQHHSNYCYDDEKENSTAEKIKRSTENWDAPVIITTSVQFFQSLYHYKSSGLRKLHNMADSVIIFDEVHTLPAEYLQPCLRAIGFITEYLNSEVMFLSATMPDFSKLFERYSGSATYDELIKDKSSFGYFQKCRYTNFGKTDIESIAVKADDYDSSLIIVNSRKTAREVYRLLSGKKYHLSTYMTPKDRSETIKQIKDDLVNGEKITVVSTSLVEAGVDLDFKAVFRQLAGLDSILQSGGRCNREGKMEYGDVFIFETDEIICGDMKTRAGIVKDMLEKGLDITSEECVRENYRRLFSYSDDIIEQNTIAKDCTRFDSIPFRTYAEGFEFIKNETISVVINNNSETNKLVQQLDNGGKNIRRKLQRYSVSLKKYEFDEAMKAGIIAEKKNGIFVLGNNDCYKDKIGLDIDYQPDYIH